MKSKECLEKISWRYVNDPSFQEWCNTIKQNLDKLEKLKEKNKELRKAIKQWNINGGNLLKENTKLKKVIEILKRNYFTVTSNANSETGYIMCVESDITQQEYELLKEVLDND